MKRPIAELLTMTVQPGAEAERVQHERAAWQILRRKQGYVTHRIYQQCSDPMQRLVYSEWESKKAVDGARQHLQGTPLMRRARATLAAMPQRLVVELAGAITSTKGLDVPDGAVAVCAIGRLVAEAPGWREHEEKISKLLSAQAGHITHVLFRGFDDPLLVGSLSHWVDPSAFAQARPPVEAAAGGSAEFATAVDFVLYSVVPD